MNININIDAASTARKVAAESSPAACSFKLHSNRSVAERRRALRRLRAAVANAVIIGLISFEYGAWFLEDIDPEGRS